MAACQRRYARTRRGVRAGLPQAPRNKIASRRERGAPAPGGELYSALKPRVCSSKVRGDSRYPFWTIQSRIGWMFSALGATPVG